LKTLPRSFSVNWTAIKEVYRKLSVRFRAAGEVKSDVYNCRVSFDDKSMETSLRV